MTTKPRKYSHPQYVAWKNMKAQAKALSIPIEYRWEGPNDFENFIYDIEKLTGYSADAKIKRIKKGISPFTIDNMVCTTKPVKETPLTPGSVVPIAASRETAKQLSEDIERVGYALGRGEVQLKDVPTRYKNQANVRKFTDAMQRGMASHNHERLHK